ncbi:MAG TPA: methyltransferase domain-containing protein [Methylococcaceae bacterium]|jgi:ubiquinone/menaquinone biosynthesis C-methylase UbiE|nr:methyltransferase domain-containing protein [Methylococcaceae bacterium]HIN69540.1 methyltransferase domain-containing protein [Methylococcales bacterium]HIA45104.1 methyltransferase domain-containing protein [Methylococcaceae bacterium]HIB63138.1 methyltransferase domain-containing protein [Methylococcaceae bacterium]HIO12237.1 methyltransferase domain-containing protein [Methylococcales bacterium]
MSQENSVLKRYSEGAKAVQPELCCPVDYDTTLLKQLPQEIIDKDYGCGDPSRYVQKNDIVLDLGSGSGKICYIAAQLVGTGGKIIGIDMNDDMLALARKYQPEMADKLGSDRVQFIKGQIQDLALDCTALDNYLVKHPIQSTEDLVACRIWQEQQRLEMPLIADNTIDLVISNCVLNLVNESDKQKMIHEIFRVIKPGGRIAIADIVSDEPVSEAMKSDPQLWSGCISGALQEHDFLHSFIKAGFQAVKLDTWSSTPWQVVENIEFRSTTVTAIKPAQTPCLDRGHAVIYRGPFSEVYDDEGHIYPRGQRIATCERTFHMLTSGTYQDNFIGIPPTLLKPAQPWCAPPGTVRAAAESKGSEHSAPPTLPCC